MRNCRKYNWNHFCAWDSNPLFFIQGVFKSHLEKNYPHLKCQFPPRIPIWPKPLLYKRSEKWLKSSVTSFWLTLLSLLLTLNKFLVFPLLTLKANAGEAVVLISVTVQFNDAFSFSNHQIKLTDFAYKWYLMIIWVIPKHP